MMNMQGGAFSTRLNTVFALRLITHSCPLLTLNKSMKKPAERFRRIDCSCSDMTAGSNGMCVFVRARIKHAQVNA